MSKGSIDIERGKNFGYNSRRPVLHFCCSSRKKSKYFQDNLNVHQKLKVVQQKIKNTSMFCIFFLFTSCKNGNSNKRKVNVRIAPIRSLCFFNCFLFDKCIFLATYAYCFSRQVAHLNLQIHHYR